MEFAESEDGEAQLNEARRQGVVMKCLIIRCYDTQCLFAHAIPSKGVDEDKFTVNLVVSAVQWLGHVRVILKSDGEPAVRSLVKKSLEEVKIRIDDMETITDEKSPPYDSQANGGTEVGIRIVRGQLRTLRLCLERRIGHRIPPNHPLMAWLLKHTAVLLNACVRGADGLTPWARARGRAFGMRIHAFAESVWWKQPAKGPQHDQEGNMAPRQFPGIFLGYNKASNTYRIMTNDGNMVKARGLQARPEDEKWEPERLKAITVTPWDLRKRAEAVKVDVGPEVERHEPPEHAPVSNPRRLKITKYLLRDPAIGTTDGCPQCRHFRSFGETKDGLPHNEVCRKRILEALAQTDAGRAKLSNHEEKVDQAIAERIREADQDAAVARRSEQPALARAASGPCEDFPGDGDAHEPAEAACNGNDDDMTPRNGDTHDQDVHHQAHEDEDVTMGSVSFEDECMEILAVMGCDGRAYRRETRKAIKKVVSEIYSPPRVTRMASLLPQYKLLPGFALDITATDPDDGQAWDFDDPAKREGAGETSTRKTAVVDRLAHVHSMVHVAEAQQTQKEPGPMPAGACQGQTSP